MHVVFPVYVPMTMPQVAVSLRLAHSNAVGVAVSVSQVLGSQPDAPHDRRVVASCG